MLFKNSIIKDREQDHYNFSKFAIAFYHTDREFAKKFFGDDMRILTEKQGKAYTEFKKDLNFLVMNQEEIQKELEKFIERKKEWQNQ